MSSNVGNGRLKDRISIPTLFFFVVVLIVLVVGGGVGTLEPSIGGVFVVAIMMAVVIVLRQNELAVTAIVAVHLYVDWYLGFSFIAQIMILVLLSIFFLSRSPRYPWVEPRCIWLWVLLLLLSIFPATRGVSLFDGISYYINIIFGSFTIYWLGLIISRNMASMQRFFKLLAVFSTLMAIHSIIQAITGVVLFASSRFDPYLALVENYELGASTIQRAGSFFVNPDSSGGFFAMMVFLPLCLFAQSTSFLGKLIYLAETLLILVALLDSYSTGGWLAAGAGFVVFIVFVGRMRERIQISFFIAIATVVILVFFPSEIVLQIQHALDPSEAILREAAWQTGIRVARAFPLTGIGLGRYVYVIRAEPYRVPLQYRPLAHPHNSYIEIAALAGLPVLVVFIALLIFTTWLALRNWLQTDARTRTLLAGALAMLMALSINSLFVSAWTLPPLAMLGWLVLGAISSPLLTRRQNSDVLEEQKA